MTYRFFAGLSVAKAIFTIIKEYHEWNEENKDILVNLHEWESQTQIKVEIQIKIQMQIRQFFFCHIFSSFFLVIFVCEMYDHNRAPNKWCVGYVF